MNLLELIKSISIVLTVFLVSAMVSIFLVSAMVGIYEAKILRRDAVSEGRHCDERC